MQIFVAQDLKTKTSSFLAKYIRLNLLPLLQNLGSKQTETFSASSKERGGKKKSLGIDALVADQATLHHMIFSALLAVCEDAIH